MHEDRFRLAIDNIQIELSKIHQLKRNDKMDYFTKEFLTGQSWQIIQNNLNELKKVLPFVEQKVSE